MRKSKARNGLASSPIDAASPEEVYAVLYDLHTFFNDRVFKAELPTPVFTIAPLGRTRLGHFSPGRWSGVVTATGRVDEVRHTTPDEINVHSEQGMARSFINVAATVYHEMCHQAQHHFPEVYGAGSKSNYHNKKWHTACQLCGLTTEGPKGMTTVTPAFITFMADFPNPERWVARRHIASDTMPTRLKKWVCQCKTHIVNEEAGTERDGPYVLRVAGSGLQAQCVLCRQMFEEV